MKKLFKPSKYKDECIASDFFICEFSMLAIEAAGSLYHQLQRIHRLFSYKENRILIKLCFVAYSRIYRFFDVVVYFWFELPLVWDALLTKIVTN